MKKIIFALLAVAFAASVCFAQESQETSSPATQSAPPISQPETKSFTGKVNSVLVGNVGEGTKPQITVTDDNGQNLTFVIDSLALITDQDGNILSPADIKNDSAATIRYTTDADGTNQAQSLKITQQEGGDNP